MALGAAIGSLCRKKRDAFLAGIASHLIADITPHRDWSWEVEPLFAVGALLGIGAWRGLDSTEFWGALGGIAPDAEHTLLISGVIRREDELFPTHFKAGKYHGRQTKKRWSQLLIAAASVAVVALASSRKEL